MTSCTLTLRILAAEALREVIEAHPPGCLPTSVCIHSTTADVHYGYGEWHATAWRYRHDEKVWADCDGGALAAVDLLLSKLRQRLARAATAAGTVDAASTSATTPGGASASPGPLEGGR